METPTLSYLIAHPAGLGLGLERSAALLLLGLAAVFVLVRPHAGRRAVALRAAAFVILVLALAGLHVTTRLPEQALRLVVAVDVSESIDDRGSQWSERYVAEALDGLAPGDEVAVITFAKETHLACPPGPPPARVALSTPPIRNATDLERALGAAAGLLPADGTRKILLLTDGNETRGDGRRCIAPLREAGIRVDVAVPPRRQLPDARIEKLIAAPSVAEDHVVPLRVVARNRGKRRPAVLSLSLDDQVMESAAVDLQPGLNTIDVPSTFAGRGSHVLSAELKVDGDERPSNNRRDVSLTVRGRTNVLLIVRTGRSTVARVLQRKGLRVDVRAASAGVGSLDDLTGYNAVVLEDPIASDLSPEDLQTLDRFVRERSGGLVVAGGTATFGDARFRKTPLETMLPVTLEPVRPSPGKREPLALFVVIDRSNSMGYNSRIGTLRDGEKLRYAKEAALTVVRQLRDEDLVGVIAFDSQPREIAPLAPLRENRQRLERTIPRLVENGGTDFFDALESARQQLAASRVSRRHVVLLTDGDTNRSAVEEYRNLIDRIADGGISVTTIRIGDNTVNLKLLQQISERTGGRFHYVQDAQALPDLMLQDASRALGTPEGDVERYYPQAGARNQALRGIDEADVPPLSGYAYARAKDAAEVPLRVRRLERRDPILAVWRYGLGRVAAFTASPSLDAAQWWSWNELGKFWSQVVHWTARDETDDTYVVETRRLDDVVHLRIRSFGPLADGSSLLARLELGDDVREIDLVPDRPRQYTAEVADLPPGPYFLTVVRRRADGTVSEQRQPIHVPAAEAEPVDEHRSDVPDMSLLAALAEGTGGRLNPAAREVADRPPGVRRATYPLVGLLVPLSMVLFLADVAVRRLKLERGAR